MKNSGYEVTKYDTNPFNNIEMEGTPWDQEEDNVGEIITYLEDAEEEDYSNEEDAEEENDGDPEDTFCLYFLFHIPC